MALKVRRFKLRPENRFFFRHLTDIRQWGSEIGNLVSIFLSRHWFLRLWLFIYLFRQFETTHARSWAKLHTSESAYLTADPGHLRRKRDENFNSSLMCLYCTFVCVCVCDWSEYKSRNERNSSLEITWSKLSDNIKWKKSATSSHDYGLNSLAYTILQENVGSFFFFFFSKVSSISEDSFPKSSYREDVSVCGFLVSLLSFHSSLDSRPLFKIVARRWNRGPSISRVLRVPRVPRGGQIAISVQTCTDYIDGKRQWVTTAYSAHTITGMCIHACNTQAWLILEIIEFTGINNPLVLIGRRQKGPKNL